MTSNLRALFYIFIFLNDLLEQECLRCKGFLLNKGMLSPSLWNPMFHTMIQEYDGSLMTCSAKCLAMSEESVNQPVCNAFLVLNGNCYLGNTVGSYFLFTNGSTGGTMALFSKSGGKYIFFFLREDFQCKAW